MGELRGGKPLGKQPVSDASAALAGSCPVETSHPIPASVPPTQPGCGFALCQKNDKKANSEI